MPDHDALSFFSFVVEQLEQGKQATVSASEAREHLDRLRRYVAVRRATEGRTDSMAALYADEVPAAREVAKRMLAELQRPFEEGPGTPDE